MNLADIIIDIQTRETGQPVAADVAAEVRALGEELETPDWLSHMFGAVQLGETIDTPVFVLSHSDAYTYLAELANLLHWNAFFDGESTEFRFPELGWHVYISHEAAVGNQGGWSYLVTRLSA